MINKLLVVINTGMPGLQKLLIFIVLERVLSISEMGEFASDYSFAQLISLFTAVGWCGIVLVRTPKLDRKKSNNYLYLVLKRSLIQCSLFIALVFFLEKKNVIYNAGEIAFFLFSWTLYQILRHFAIAKKKHRKIFFSDISSLSVFLLMLAQGVNAFTAISISFLFSAFILSFGQISFNKGTLAVDDQKKSLDFSISNFLVSLGIMALPVLVSNTNGVELAGLIGYITSMIIALQLLTRALAFFYIPELAAIQTKERRNKIYRQFIMINTFVAVISAIVMIGVYLLIIKFSLVDIFQVNNSALIYGLLLLNGFVLSLTVPPQHYLMAIEEAKILLKNSYIYAVLTISGFILYYLTYSFYPIEILLCYLVLARVCSYLFLQNKVKELKKINAFQ